MLKTRSFKIIVYTIIFYESGTIYYKYIYSGYLLQEQMKLNLFSCLKTKIDKI